MPDQISVRNERDSEPVGALDVPEVGLADLVVPSTDDDGYFEDENWRPDPLAQYGTVDTSDTGGGGAHGSIADASPVFAEARAMNLLVAARALDPEDDSVGEELVTLPQGSVSVTGSTRTVADGRQDIEVALKRLAEDPIVLGGPTPEQRVAAQEYDQDSYEGRAGTRSYAGRRFAPLGGGETGGDGRRAAGSSSTSSTKPGEDKGSKSGNPASSSESNTEGTTPSDNAASTTASTTGGSPASGGRQRGGARRSSE
jgi:hypothetical protein